MSTIRDIQEPAHSYESQAASVGMQQAAQGSNRLSAISAQEIMTANPLTASPNEAIQTVATRMVENRISCLPVVEGRTLVGLVTEADFVGRVVASGVSVQQPVSTVMSDTPWSVAPQQSVLDVLTLLTRHRIAHMPVCDDTQLLGIVTQTDIIKHQIASSVFMIGDILRMNSSQDIAGVATGLPRLLSTLVNDNSSSFETGRVMSSITGAITRRLIELAQTQLGPSPVPFAWLACGSQGRQEQTGATDQDNCLVLSDDYSEDMHGEYFSQLAQFVCDGLNESGYVYCPGDMMATNTQWRQPISVWQDYYQNWIERPGPEAQMLASVMFDLRLIYGDSQLSDILKTSALERARSNSIFIAHMTSNCLTHRPPFGWLNRLKPASKGVHAGKLDLKMGGVVPIVDIARLYALSAGEVAVNTIERLSCGAESGVLSRSGAQSLCDAFETISTIRLKHQVRQIGHNRPPDNYIDLTTLKSHERDRLKRAMLAVKEIQTTMSSRIAMMGR